MTIIAILLAVFLVAQFVFHAREQRKIQEAYEQERASLLDRIQHPEVRQVQPGEIVEHEPPKDEAELAHVGQIVPEFVRVGETGAGNGSDD